MIHSPLLFFSFQVNSYNNKLLYSIKKLQGFDAFQHELYGDTITVERRIVAEGASSNYILKDCRGKVVARKRTDLDNMLSVLNIDAANPVACMTQDTARNFLAGSSAAADKQKYDMYMEATQLGTIAYNLSISKSQVIEMVRCVFIYA